MSTSERPAAPGAVVTGEPPDAADAAGVEDVEPEDAEPEDVEPEDAEDAEADVAEPGDAEPEPEPEAEVAEPEPDGAEPEGAAGFTWLLADFATRVVGVRNVLAVSADGLLMAMSPGLGRTQADTVAAIVAGLTSLVRGASGHLRGGSVRQSIVEMDELFLFSVSVSEGAVLAVVADADCDVGLVGYEMAVLASRAEAVLTPALIDEARALLPLDDPAASPR